MRPVKKREIPGPASLSKQKEGVVIEGEVKTKENSFKSVSWLALNNSLGYNDFEDNKRESISLVLQGKFDLRVPRLAVIVEKVQY